MTETGWPLIPREVLPAPVPAAKRPAPPRPAPSADAGRQLPFFGAETTEPSPADLAGLLAGPGHLGRMGGTARVSVAVEGAWRVHVLVAELVVRGLVVHWRPADDQEQRQDQARDEDVRDVGSPRAFANPASGGHTSAAASHRSAPSTPSDPTDDFESPESQDPESQYPESQDLESQDLESQDLESLDLESQDLESPEPESQDPESSGPGPSQEPEPSQEPSPSQERGPESESPGPSPAAESSELIDSEEEKPEKSVPRFEVLTAYSRRLNGLAQAWPQAAAQLFLSGPRLRLWVAAAGEPIPGGYALGLDPAKDVTEIDAALVRAGLAGQISDDGRQYLLIGKKRVARLAELVGERPEAAPAGLWPGGAAA
ncbi:hypothetical protein [Paractinoplanes maris]|uniref:hypothetical protein n=1 Tax=Paractinoplanes maris TaxID=1734446 RepID=UPI003F68D557